MLADAESVGRDAPMYLVVLLPWLITLLVIVVGRKRKG